MPESDSPWIYLASQSPRRRELLAQWGVSCQLLLPDAGEDAEALERARPGETPRAYVQRVTRAKLHAALARLRRRGWPPAPVLCADTTVALGRAIFGKPADEQEARAMLSALSGRSHRVLTAVAVGTWGASDAAPQLELRVSESRVRFAPLSPERIARYVATGEPMGKAGAYAIQGLAALWVTHISGSHSGIVGLPAHETAELLRAAGVDLP